MAAAQVFDVGAHGEFLATRSKARTVRDSLEKQVDAPSSGSEVVIDFVGVDAMTISFADEFLGKFYTSVAAGDVSAAVVVLSGLNDETRETISVCLERRDLVAASVDRGELRLIAAPEFLVETYEHAANLKTFRANDLSESLGVTLSNMNNRLKRLAAVGALRRERSSTSNRGGKEYVYSIPSA
ncbi:STAS-like domain-containing protein [Lentzea aerocolonigenes]|uniref:STAS-like domain-containing protein n=1 Tax=Lentzea aerocolonigenes TaxID=68170 RepID=UPI0009DFD8E1|nr:DUF4325 domain-containing protein [Lentzea aerocolonigenes]